MRGRGDGIEGSSWWEQRWAPAGMEQKGTKGHKSRPRHPSGPRSGGMRLPGPRPEEKEPREPRQPWRSSNKGPWAGAGKGNINLRVSPRALYAAGAGHGAQQLQGWRKGGARQSKSSPAGSAPQGRASPAGIWKARLLSGTCSSRRRVEKAPADTAAPHRFSVQQSPSRTAENFMVHPQFHPLPF